MIMGSSFLSLLFVLGAATASPHQNVRREKEDAKMLFEKDVIRIQGIRAPWRVPSAGIINGNAAAAGEYPWFVSLESSSNFKFCGGSLLSANRVLTAAHCVVDGAGNPQPPDHIRTNHVALTDGETVGVSCVSIHPDYGLDCQGLYRDYAVITLSGNVQNVTGGFVTLNSNTGYPSESGQTLTAIGYGRTVSGGSGSSTLLKADEAFVTESDCQSSWQCASSEFHVCAAEGTNTGVCQGDSGGPLLDSSNVQVALTSFGDALCGDRADVFANVAPFHDWIMGELTSGTCTSTHTFGDTPCGTCCMFLTAMRNAGEAVVGCGLRVLGFVTSGWSIE